MKEHSVCFTGHREIPKSEILALSLRLIGTIEGLILQGFTDFYAGGALGFDSMAENAVLEAKKKYPSVHLHLCLPCPEQADRWSASSKAEYQNILSQADSITYACEKYRTGCMHKRNKMLVMASSVCVCYYSSGGGTEYTVNLARDEGLKIINLI